MAYYQSCFSVKVTAPYNQNVSLAGEHEALPILEKKTNWYALFGSVLISDNSTNEIIDKNQFSKVRVTTKLTFGNYVLNAVLNMFLPSTIVTNTTVVEGIRDDGSTSTTDSKGN